MSICVATNSRPISQIKMGTDIYSKVLYEDTLDACNVDVNEADSEKHRAYEDL